MKQNNFTLGGKLKHWRKNKHAQSKTDDGDIVVARHGNEYTIKRFRKTASETWLESANSIYEPITDNFEVIGIIMWLVKKFK